MVASRGDGYRPNLPVPKQARRVLHRRAVSPGDEPRLQLALALDLERTSFLEQERFAQQSPGALGHLHASGHTVRFHPAGGVYGVTPHIIEVHAFADDAGHHRSAGDADTYLRRVAATLIEAVQRVDHVDRRVRRLRRMIGRWDGHAGGGHIRVPERLDLPEAALFRDGVE